jgi:ribosome-binding protein aMBF1 (putative translation factor)
MNYQTMTLANREYVLVPKKDYLAFDKLHRRHAKAPARETVADAVPALERVRSVIGQHLRTAREQAKLTQGDLAKKLECSQTMVSLAEKGEKHIGAAYIRRVLSACGLPADWRPNAK